MVTTPETPAVTSPAAKPRAARKVPAKPRAAAKPRIPARRSAATSSVPVATSVLSVGAAILAVGAAIAGFLARRRIAGWVSPDAAGHKAPDLAPGPARDTRAPVDFRPDMAAPISAAEREALRPATGPAPSLTAAAGTLDSQTGASN